jgi:hypothetical protein
LGENLLHAVIQWKYNKNGTILKKHIHFQFKFTIFINIQIKTRLILFIYINFRGSTLRRKSGNVENFNSMEKLGKTQL